MNRGRPTPSDWIHAPPISDVPQLEHELEQGSIHDTSTRRLAASYSHSLLAASILMRQTDNAGTWSRLGQLIPASIFFEHVIFP